MRIERRVGLWFVDRARGLIMRAANLPAHLELARLRLLAGLTVRYVPQGPGGLTIDGPLWHDERRLLDIHPTAVMKSGTYIDTRGGVWIGRYFHQGRGLTIFSSDHDYRNASAIPYGSEYVLGEVTIRDFVWVGADVTILPGVTIGEGAIIGAASVITRDVEPLTIVAGNPARPIGRRDAYAFELLKEKGAFH